MASPNLPDSLTYKSSAVSAIKYQTLSAACAGSLVVPIALLISHCPAGVRRSPVFVLLLCNLIVGVVWAILSYAENMNTVMDPLGDNSRGLFLGSSALNFLIPIFTDMTLVWKILWLFPSTTYKKWQRILLVATPCILFIPRLTVISVFLYNAGVAYDSTGGISAAVSYMGQPRLPLCEFSLQLVSNTYCASILLYKARSIIRIDPNIATHRSQALQKRFATMAKVLASSFLVPVALEIAVIAAYAANNHDTFVKEPIQWLNTYVSLHCAVIATVWSSIDHPSSDTSASKNHSVDYTGELGTKRSGYATSQYSTMVVPISGALSRTNSHARSVSVSHYPMTDFGADGTSAANRERRASKVSSIQRFSLRPHSAPRPSSSTARPTFAGRPSTAPLAPSAASRSGSFSSLRPSSSTKFHSDHLPVLPFDSVAHSIDIEKDLPRPLPFADLRLESLADIEQHEKMDGDEGVYHIR